MSVPAAPLGGAPRVAVLVDALSVNGAVKIAVDLAARWSGGGTVLVELKSLPPEQCIAVPDGVRRARLSGAAGLPLVRMPLALLRTIRVARRTDAVLVGSEVGPGLVAGYLGARIAGRPFLIGVHADLDDALAEWTGPVLRRVLRWIHRRADGVVCVEAQLTGPVLRNGLPAERVTVVPNGVDVAAVRAAAAAPDPFADVPGPRVVATGRLAPQKATDVLLRAHAAVVGEAPHRVLLLNDGPDLPALRRLAADLGVERTVVFAGRVPPHPTVAAADLFCLPSRHEGLPLSLLEAMAVGVPCLATDSSAGVRHALDDGRAGELVPVGDVDALAAALRRHLVDPAPLRARAALATTHLLEFDVDAMAAGWAAAIGAMVERGARRARPDDPLSRGANLP